MEVHHFSHPTLTFSPTQGTRGDPGDAGPRGDPGTPGPKVFQCAFMRMKTCFSLHFFVLTVCCVFPLRETLADLVLATLDQEDNR